MKKYHVFSHDMYYPAGGIHDLRESFETLEEAKKAGWEESADDVYIVETQEDGSLKVILTENAGFWVD